MESISPLCGALKENILIAAEAAVALKQCNALNHPVVVASIRPSKTVEKLVLKYCANIQQITKYKMSECPLLADTVEKLFRLHGK